MSKTLKMLCGSLSLFAAVAFSGAAHADKALVKMENNKSCAAMCNAKEREPVYLGDATGSYLCAGSATAIVKDQPASVRAGEAPAKGGACNLMGGGVALASYCVCAPKDFDQMFKASKK